MAEINQEIEEPAEVVEQLHKEAVDHIPLKDEFSSDLSDLDLNDYGQKQQDQGERIIPLKPKKKKIIKTYEWRSRWVRQQNIVPGSKSLWLKRWVRVKYMPTEQQLQEFRQQNEDKDRGALELAHAIIQEHMNIEK